MRIVGLPNCRLVFLCKAESHPGRHRQVFFFLISSESLKESGKNANYVGLTMMSYTF